MGRGTRLYTALLNTGLPPAIDRLRADSDYLFLLGRYDVDAASGLHTPDAAGGLALDEALLDLAEQVHEPAPFQETKQSAVRSSWLRLWEPREPLVVLGRSGRVGDEVNVEACAARGIPILRRSSGGGTILTGPGCLMYAVVLDYESTVYQNTVFQSTGGGRDVQAIHCYVLRHLAKALAPLVPGVTQCGTSDLAVGSRKFSGNSLRCRRSHFLYHGTLMYDLSVNLVAACLKSPPRQPEYRERREHAEFVANLALDRETLRRAVIKAWPIDSETSEWPRERVATLVAEKYSQAEWNLGL